MPDNTQVEQIRQKYVAIAPHLDERGRRQWAAVEARAIGWGGVATVAAATGLSDRTVRTGIQELGTALSRPAVPAVCLRASGRALISFAH